MNFVQHEDMGFSKEDPIIVTNLNELEKSETLRQKLLLNPAIKEVSFSSSSPVSDYNHHYGTSFRLPGQREEEGKEAEEKGVDLNFLSFYKLELLAGRNFATLEENFTEFIVNEKLIKAIGCTPEQAVGQKLVIYVDPAKSEYYSKVNSMSFADKQAMVGKTVPANTQQSVASFVPETEGDFITYTVRYGDTIWDIVKMFDNVSTSQVLTLNNISDPSKIQVGQKLKIKKKS